MYFKNIGIIHQLSTEYLGVDKYDNVSQEDWDHISVVGTLMYLANNSRPYIVFAVNQCTRCIHCPKESHSRRIKLILRFLHKTITKGMYIKLSQDLHAGCYVDADFAGLWGIS